MFDIVAYVYSNVDRRAWIAASSNVRLHVDHLAQQHKLPKVITNMLPASNTQNIFDKSLVHIGENRTPHLAYGRIRPVTSGLFGFLFLVLGIYIHSVLCVSPCSLL